MNEWIYIGIYSFVLVSGFVQRDIPVTTMTLLATAIRKLSRLALFGFLGYLLYLGRFVDLQEWIVSYSAGYNDNFVDILFLLMWLSCPVAQLSVMNISLSVATFETRSRNHRHLFSHLVTLLLSLELVYCSQKFLSALSDKIIAISLPPAKMNYFIVYDMVPMNYTHLAMGVAGVILYGVMGIISQR